MREENTGTITVGTDLESSKEAIKISETYPDISWATVGLHPTDNTHEGFDTEKYRELAKHQKVVAIGECGLDYFRITNDEERIKNEQKDIFKQHIELAIEVGKPLMIHARPSKDSMDAYVDAIEILSSYSNIRANFHFFVGNIEIANKIAMNGWSMSFDGPITFTHDYENQIKSVPLENIMAETDAPFAAPVPYRGKTCEPWMVKEVYKKIAEVRGANEDIVQKQLLINAKNFFQLS